MLVFPKIVKVGFVLGGAYGEGALLQGGKTLGYYNSSAASYGLQAGVQGFGYALFFMHADALKYLDLSSGASRSVSAPALSWSTRAWRRSSRSTTLTQDVYAFIFNQKGLMAGLGVEGSKITRIR